MTPSTSSSLNLDSESVLNRFPVGFMGRLIRQGDVDYSAARCVYNRSIDRYPLAIAACCCEEDIIQALRFARREKLPVAIRSSGHNAAGNSVCDNGLVIDLRRMNQIHVDPVKKQATVQPGVSWKEMDAATQRYDLATPGGTVSSTSVSGFTFGGGLGWLMGCHGLACDNLREVRMVLADGAVVTANAETHADLFWALRGGGGNFGIVSQLTFDLHPVPVVTAGSIIVPLDQSSRAVRFFAELRKISPPELVICPTFLQRDGAAFLSFDVCFNGPKNLAQPWIERLEKAVPFPHNLRERSYVEWQTIYDAAFEDPMRGYWRSFFFQGDMEAVATVLADYFAVAPSPHSVAILESFHGAYKQPKATAGAYAHRDKNFSVLIAARWENEQEDRANLAWIKALSERLRPYTDGSAYINYLGVADAETVEKAYGGTVLERLSDIKKRYDPDILFTSPHGLFRERR
jgi:FAD/FMN-containing dehydrogenase